MSAALGLNRVKEELGGDQSQALLGTRLMTPAGQGTVADNPLVVPPPGTAGGGGKGGAQEGAGGARRREGGAVAAAPAIAPVASMFTGFPVVGGFFNAAAFAAAAAAVFPGGIIPTTTAQTNPANPMMMTSQGTMLMSPGKTTADSPTTPAAAGQASPLSKRRKRGRAEDGQPEVKPEAGGGGIGTTTTGGVGGVGGSLMSKLEGNYPHQDGVGVAGGTAAAGGAAGNGVGGAPWVGGAMNVLTPNLFEGDMSNQERKERRKIRNRMSAQQHRERQRQRVDTLEDCLRQRDQEIANLKGEVASLSDKNRRLTGLVRQLEADSCPNLDDVLNGLGDECHSSLILPTPASSSSSSSSPQCAVGVTKEKDHEDRYSHLHALNPTSSFLSCVPRVGQGGSGAVSVVSEADGIVDSMAGGVGEDTDGSGGGVTTDQAQSSSSESDFDDLSPLSTLGSRTGGAPSTPPLSPARDDGNASSVSGDGSSRSPSPAFALSKANFSLRASSSFSSFSKARLPVAEAAVAGLPRIPEFSVPAGVFSSTPCEAAAGEGKGGASVGSSPDGSIAAAAAAAAAATAGGAGGVVPEGGLCAGLLSSGTGQGVGGGGEEGVAGGAGEGENCGKDEDEPMEISGVFGTGTGAVDEDDLTMGALDPMEIDALLACADEDSFKFNSDNPATTPAAAAPTATSSEPDNLESGNSSGSHMSDQPSHDGTAVEGGRGAGAPRRLGGGVAGAVLAGSLCLAGVVLNNNSGPPLGGGRGATFGREVVRAPLSPAHAGRRVLSAVQNEVGDGDETEEGEAAAYGNATGAGSWVFHPVEAEPWLWRSTSAREGKAPWRWTSALNLFRDPQMAPIDTPARRTSAFDRNPSSPSPPSASSPSSSPSAVREHDGGVLLEGELVEFQDFVIAGLYDGDESAGIVEAANALASDDGDRDGGSGVGEGGRVESERLGQQAPDQLSGKEVDLFYRSPNGYIHSNANGNGVHGMNPNNGDHRTRDGFRGGGRGGAGRAGMGMRQPPGVHGEDVMAPDRTSYVFCPEAHGMMSGGMIQRANQAMYDHHHPGARPFTSAAGAAGSGALTRAIGLGVGHGVGEERIAFKGRSEVKVNVVDSHHNQHQLRLTHGGDGDGDEDGDNLGADNVRSSSLAVVSSSSGGGGSNSNSGLFFDASAIGEGGEGAEAIIEAGGGGGGGGSGVGRGGGRRGDGGRGEGIPRRRGPAPIHIGGQESLDGIIGEEGGAANAGSEGFHSSLRRSDNAEYMTMLVPPGALDWGPSSLAVQSALNATSGASANGGEGEGGAWVEIDCRVLDIRLVQDVSFAP